MVNPKIQTDHEAAENRHGKARVMLELKSFSKETVRVMMDTSFQSSLL